MKRKYLFLFIRIICGVTVLLLLGRDKLFLTHSKGKTVSSRFIKLDQPYSRIIVKVESKSSPLYIYFDQSTRFYLYSILSPEKFNQALHQYNEEVEELRRKNASTDDFPPPPFDKVFVQVNAIERLDLQENDFIEIFYKKISLRGHPVALSVIKYIQ